MHDVRTGRRKNALGMVYALDAPCRRLRLAIIVFRQSFDLLDVKTV
ncbi:hypothetical protein [Bradyrhizobium sp. RT9a]